MVTAGGLTTHVVCFGNRWHGDDGVGIHVYQRLVDDDLLPPSVRAFDAGTAGISALDHFLACDKVVVVDACQTGSPIGAVHRSSVAGLDSPGAAQTTHDMGVDHVVAALPVLVEECDLPEIVVIGVEVGDLLAFTGELTPPVADAVDRAIEWIQRECTS